MDPVEIEALELDFLLDVVRMRYGYDFRSYARASLKRRVRIAMERTGVGRISELATLLLHDAEAFGPFLQKVTVSVTEMFRDPAFFRNVREHVVPVLRSYPFLKVWCAGCATGEEPYSLAIVLAEEGLLARTQIYATDIDADALEVASNGIYPVERIRRFTENYNRAGGKRSLSDYYHARYEAAKLADPLRNAITFSHYNLAGDWVFAEMNLILCRNVMIYFDQTLQEHVTKLFHDSLCHRGFLCLGAKEHLGPDMQHRFEIVDQRSRIFRRAVQSVSAAS